MSFKLQFSWWMLDSCHKLQAEGHLSPVLWYPQRNIVLCLKGKKEDEHLTLTGLYRSQIDNHTFFIWDSLRDKVVNRGNQRHQERMGNSGVCRLPLVKKQLNRHNCYPWNLIIVARPSTQDILLLCMNSYGSWLITITVSSCYWPPLSTMYKLYCFSYRAEIP
jgi:hypothetical protein